MLPDDIQKWHKELNCIQSFKVCCCCKRLLQCDELLDQVLSVCVLVAVGVPQVAPPHRHQHYGDLTVNNVNTLT